MLTLIRIIKSGVTSFRRNIWLSSATTFVLVLSLSVALGVILFGVIVDGVVKDIESKVDISVYFAQDANPERIAALQQEIEGYPGVTETQFTSREEALLQFRQRHAQDTGIQEALDELPENPLEASLAIRAADASAYQAVATFIETSYSDVISKVNYHETSTIINRVFSVTRGIQISGFIIGVVLFVVAGLIAFNTIRLAIFSFREEIAIMRLVGASNWFIRGPFIVAGVLNGVLAAVVTFALLYGAVLLVDDPVGRFIPGVDLRTYYLTNWLTILFLLAGLGIATTAASSVVAIRRYLKV